MMIEIPDALVKKFQGILRAKDELIKTHDRLTDEMKVLPTYSDARKAISKQRDEVGVRHTRVRDDWDGVRLKIVGLALDACSAK